MNIAVLSGKGGTGKTLVSVNLAALSTDTIYIDCDVEEPNGHLFLKPLDLSRESVTVKMPKIDENKCIGCRMCTEFCEFNALAFVGDKVMLFEDVCHSCGGCAYLCPTNAISEVSKEIGHIDSGISQGTQVITGYLNIGEASGVPIINELVKKSRKASNNVFIDCPPGSACVVMESIKEADYCVLVAEPTIFGIHNVKMVYELVSKFNIPVGVVINKYYDEVNPATEFCKENKLTILGSIPYDIEISELNGNGKVLVREDHKYKDLFKEILDKISLEVSHETTSNT